MFIFTGRTYKFYGGAESLLINLVRELKTINKKTGIIGLSDNYAVKILRREHIDFVFIDWNNIDLRLISQDDILIIFGYSDDLLKLKKINPKIIFWNIFPDLLLSLNATKYDKYLTNDKKPFFWRYTKKLIQALQRSNGIYFMDGANTKTIMNILLPQFEIKYIPIPIPSSKYLYRPHFQGNAINLTYVGRGDEIWKIMPIKKVLQDITNLKTVKKINIHIVSQITNLFSQHLAAFESANLNIFYHDDILGDKLRYFLIKNSNIHFAMGTSALEGAVLGIPTVLLDYSYAEFPINYKYRWIYETEDYSLGYNINYHYPIGLYQMEDIVSSICNDNERSLISRKCYEYVNSKHSLGNTVQILLDIDSNAKLRDFLKYCKQDWFIRKAFHAISKITSKF